MPDHVTGREPRLSSDLLGAPASGHEPMLGGEALQKLYRDELLKRLFRQQTTHLRREAIGYWLARSGDPRPGIGVGQDGLPDFDWCLVPAGEVALGDFKRTFKSERCYIARYPVTWSQYRIFLEAPDGFVDPQWWGGLRQRPEYERTAVLFDNHPVQEVSWYDAIAYTRWLNARLPYDVRLPTEAEWQMAASDGDPVNVYPWGPEWEPIYANTRESGLRRATAVGMYPMAGAPCGALDMSGTVLEWCMSAYTDPDNNSLDGSVHRVMRGGSWFLTSGFARTFSRTGDNPYYRFNSVGFRLAADRIDGRSEKSAEQTESTAEGAESAEDQDGLSQADH